MIRLLIMAIRLSVTWGVARCSLVSGEISLDQVKNGG
jgi:hypothetical protein